MDSQKVLITGAWGFIFSNFVRAVAFEKMKGYDWITLDNYSGPLAFSNRFVNKGFSKQIVADITDAKIIDAIFHLEQPNIVIHAAAQTSVDKSLSQEDLFQTTNVFGTQLLIDASIKYGAKKFIYISTDEVYGSLANENDLSWTEASIPNPRNPYSRTKLEGEKIVIKANQEHGLVYNITRASNNYGERQTTDKLIPRTIKCILNNEKIPVYGNGMQIRDWLYVKDNVDAILTILEKGEDNQIYNICANQEMTNIEIIHRICKTLNRGHDLIEYIKDPRGNAHDFRYAMDCSKLKALGWGCKFRLADALPYTVEWYEKNRNWALK
jgi:dTDP-glucose 4,6-dehydratase